MNTQFLYKHRESTEVSHDPNMKTRLYFYYRGGLDVVADSGPTPTPPKRGIRNMQHGTVFNIGHRSPLQKNWGGGLLALLCLVASIVGTPVNAQRVHRNVEISRSSDEASTKMTIQNDTDKIQIEIDGEITLSPDDRSITKVTDGGFFKIKKTTFGNTRELLIKSSGGSLSYEYKEGGRNTPFEPAGRAWLADILPDMVRSTTIGAEARVDRIYQQGGTKAVLQEIGNLKSEHVKSKYASLLFKKDIKDSEIPQLIQGVGQHITSDFYRYEVFKNNSKLLLSNPQNVGQYLNAIKTVGSDHYKTELVKLAFSNNIPNQHTTQALQLIATINSDHYKSEILRKMVKTNTLNEDQLEFMLNKLLPEINSDHYRNEIITDILTNQQKLGTTGINQVITAIGQTRSDHYATESLKRLVQHQTLSTRNYDALFTMLNGIGSDHYKAEFMRMLARDPNFGKHTDLYLKQTENMGSDHYRVEALKDLLTQSKLSDEQKVNLVRSAASIRSEHYKSELLKQACSGGSEAVKKAVAETAKTINSSHYYGEVMKCIR